MLCAAHLLPLRPCLWASRAAVSASHASDVGKVRKHARTYSPNVCTTVQATKNSASTWEQDLADVLQEPEVTFLYWFLKTPISVLLTTLRCHQVRRANAASQLCICRAKSTKKELTSLCSLGRQAGCMQQLLLVAAKSRLVSICCDLRYTVFGLFRSL